MKTTTICRKTVLASALAAMTFCALPAREGLADGQEFRLLKPQSQGEVVTIRPGQWSEMIRNSDVLLNEDHRKIYRTREGELYIWSRDAQGVQWIGNPCDWIPWWCSQRKK